jgi:hypothetical protein
MRNNLAGLAAGAFRVAVVSPEHLVPSSQVLAALMAYGVDRFIIDEGTRLKTGISARLYDAAHIAECFSLCSALRVYGYPAA